MTKKGDMRFTRLGTGMNFLRGGKGLALGAEPTPMAARVQLSQKWFFSALARQWALVCAIIKRFLHMQHNERRARNIKENFHYIILQFSRPLAMLRKILTVFAATD
jgi:hypothetical protein